MEVQVRNKRGIAKGSALSRKDKENTKSLTAIKFTFQKYTGYKP